MFCASCDVGNQQFERKIITVEDGKTQEDFE
jgi:hypothetical protein